MDLRKLKNYLNRTITGVKDNCYFIDKQYAISNTYSIVLLNNNYDMNIVDDKYVGYYSSISQFINHFKNDTKKLKSLEKEDLKEDYYSIDNDYGIQIKFLNEIKRLIKADNITILKFTDDDYMKYLIEIKNTKTNEVGYLLPSRNF